MTLTGIKVIHYKRFGSGIIINSEKINRNGKADFYVKFCGIEEEKMYIKCPKRLLGVELKEVDKYQFFEQEIVQWDNSDDDSRVLALKKDSSYYYKRS